MTYRAIPPFGSNFRAMAEVVNGLLNGKANNTGSVTLADGSATSTTLSDERIGYGSVILLMPTTANAAAWMNDVYVSARNKGSATLSHSANSVSDRTYGYVVIG